MIDADFQEDTWPRTADDALETPPPLPDETTVPLNRLVEGGNANVRTSATKVEIEALAASIKHRGLLQGLIVAAVGDSYKVGGGNRRLRALLLLAKRGEIRKDEPIKVKFVSEDELREVSLTENVMRVQLHPVDEFEAFRDLSDSGQTVQAIANHFGLKEKQVRQRLALGRLAPEVRKAWRDGKIGQEQAESFTICDDPAVQCQALEIGLKNKNHWDSWQVDRILKAGREPATSASMKFVGRDAYLAAGGTLREDLFGNLELIEAPEMLARLVAEKLEAIRQDLLAKGWNFVAMAHDIRDTWNWPKLPLTPWLTEDEKAIIGGNRRGSWETTQAAVKRIMEIPEARAASGVIVSVNAKGEIELDVLRLQPAADDSAGDDDDEDVDADDGDRGDAEGAGTAGPTAEAGAAAAEESGPALTKVLQEDLTDELGDAIAVCLVEDPDLALRAAVAALGSKHWGSPIKLKADGSPRRKPDRDPTFAARFAQLDGLSRELLLVELGRALAGSIETRQSQREFDDVLVGGIDALIAAIDPDSFRAQTARLFEAGKFFDRAPGAVARACAAECGAGPIKGNKAELATQAIEIAQRTGWLPGPLRTIHYRAPAAPGGAA